MVPVNHTASPSESLGFPLEKIQKASRFVTGRVPTSILQSCPIDVLVADHSSDRDMDAIFGSDHSKIPDWMEWIRHCPAKLRPSVIIQVWPSWSLTAETGPAGKFPRKTLEGCGYDLRYRVIPALHYGRPVWQQRLVIIGFKHSSPGCASVGFQARSQR